MGTTTGSKVSPVPPASPHLKDLAAAFDAASDLARLRIVLALAQAPLNGGALRDGLGIPQARTSRQLAFLRAAGLVESTKRGTEIRYSLTAKGRALARASRELGA